MTVVNAENNQKVTVIVPVYNVAQYVDKCLKSICEQTFKRLAIIVVDDGSTDGSGDICNRWAKLDDRIQVYHTDNCGLSAARNYGLDRVGDTSYVTFVDSDDWVDPTMIEMMLDVAQIENADCVAIGYCMDYENGNRVIRVHSQKEVVSGMPNCLKLFMEGALSATAWSKLYKASLWNDIRFPVGKLHEDLWVFVPILAKVTKLVLLNCAPYHYIQRTSSIMGHSFHPRRMDQVLAVQSWKEYTKKDKRAMWYSRAAEFRYSWYLLVYMRGQFDKVNEKCFNDLVCFLRQNKDYVMIDGLVDQLMAIIIAYGGPARLILLIREQLRKISERQIHGGKKN